jgi:Flp pilus assembly protein protease CpaA
VFLPAIVLLEVSLSSYFDFKAGKIPNKLNILLFSINSAISLWKNPYSQVFIRILAVIPLSLVFYKIGFGGGDCKLIIAISPLLSPLDISKILVLACIIALTKGGGYFHSYYLALSSYIFFLSDLIKNLKIS